MDTHKTTVLIPTHNRHAYLERCVDWFLSGGYPVVVADSSLAPWQGPLASDPRVSYLHFPGGFEQYMPKIVAGLSQVVTPYVAFCADDDFILHSGLKFATDFLELNSDYSFCQGMAYFYQRINHRFVAWPILYQQDFSDDSWLERVLPSKNTVYYGLHRTRHVAEAFRFLRDQPMLQQMPAAGLTDFVLTALIARAGKLKFAAMPFGMREYSPVVSCVGTRHELILDQNLPAFYRNFLDRLIGGDSISEPDLLRLKKFLASDLAGQIQYDLSASRGVRHRVGKVPQSLLGTVEYLYRQYNALRMVFRPGGVSALSLFSQPDFVEIRRRVLNWEG